MKQVNSCHVLFLHLAHTTIKIKIIARIKQNYVVVVQPRRQILRNYQILFTFSKTELLVGPPGNRSPGEALSTVGPTGEPLSTEGSQGSHTWIW